MERHPVDSPVDLVDGPRACTDYELPPVLDMLNLVFRVEAGRQPTVGRDWPQICRPSNLENVRVLFLNHQPVSSIAIFASTVRAGAHRLRVGGVSGVATHPDFRRRGLAGTVLRDTHQRMLDDGCDIGLLSTGITDWYRGFGWEHGALERVFTLDRNTVRYLPPLVNADVVAGIDPHLDAVHRLHDREPSRAERSPELTRILFCRPQVTGYVAVRSGKVVAYALVAHGMVVEYGGAGGDVAGLVAEMFQRLDDLSVSTSTRDRARSGSGPTLRLQINTPPRDEGFGGLLEHLGIPAQHHYLGMLRVVNVRQLLGKLAPRIIVECDDNDQAVLRDGDERLTLSRRDLVKLCFGPERVFHFANDLLPVRFYQYPLDRV